MNLSALVAGPLVLLALAGNAGASIPIAATHELAILSTTATNTVGSAAGSVGEPPQRASGETSPGAGSTAGAIDAPTAHASGPPPPPAGEGDAHGADLGQHAGKAPAPVGKLIPNGARAAAQSIGKALAPAGKLLPQSAGPITRAVGKAPSPPGKPGGVVSEARTAVQSLPVAQRLAPALARSVGHALIAAGPIPRDLGSRASTTGGALTPVIDGVSRIASRPLAPLGGTTRVLLEATRDTALRVQDDAASATGVLSGSSTALPPGALLSSPPMREALGNPPPRSRWSLPTGNGPGEKLEPSPAEPPMASPASAVSHGPAGSAAGVPEAASAPAGAQAWLASKRGSGSGGPWRVLRPTLGPAPGGSALPRFSAEAPIGASVAGDPARGDLVARAPSPTGPTPGGAAGSTAGAVGVAMSVVLGLAGLLLLGPAGALRRLRLSSEPWLTATFALMPERPG